MPPRPPLQPLLAIPHTLRPLLYRTLKTFPRTLSTSASATAPASTSPQPTTSIDPTEIGHFSSLASSWWDPHGPSRLLHLMNPLRHTFIASCLSSQPDARDPTRKLSYLDVGCGGGIFAESAARLPGAASVLGIDPSREVLAVARGHARRDPRVRGVLEYRDVGVEGLDAPVVGREGVGGGYDVVTLFEVLEHVSRPAEFLDVVGAQVRPGGWLVLSTIARTWTSWLTTKVVAEEVLGIVPRGTHEWEKYVNEGEVRGHFETRAGWTGARAMGVVYVPALGWREVRGSEEWGNYFFAVRRALQ